MKPTTAFVRAFFVVAAGLGFVGCDSPHSPGVTGIAATATKANTDADNTCPGKSGGDCQMAVSVLLNAQGNATLIVRTGSYDETTGTQAPNGTFDKVQWKVEDANGKQVSTTNDKASGIVYSTALPANFKPTYTVDVQANIDDQSGKKGNAVVRGTGTPVYAPDINLSTKSVDIVAGTQRSPASLVLADSATTYAVDITNLTAFGGAVSTTGVSVQCVVSVDGIVQVPGVNSGLAFVGGSSLYVAPGQTTTCSFTLSLGSGPHTVKVTAVETGLFAGRDGSKNSVSATVTAEKHADVSIVRIERTVTGGPAVPGPTFGTVNVGSAQSFAVWVTAPSNSLPTDATCDATIAGIPSGTYQLAWTTKVVHLSGDTQACTFTLTAQNPGTVAITATVTSVGDPVLTNNTSGGTLIVNPNAPPTVTTDLIARSITPIVPLITGGGPVTYSAPIGVLTGGTNTTANFTCSVTATRASGVGAPAVVTVLPVTGPASTTADGQCRFTLGGLTDNNGQNETYHISVTATPTDANELAAANNTVTADQVVQPKSIDLFVRSILQQVGATTQPVGQINGGSAAQFVAAIGVAGGNQTSSTVTCTATAINLRTNASTTLPTTVGGPATTGADALCTFSATLAANGNIDENYQLVVTTSPVGITDIAPTNNTLAANLTAIIRVDVSVTNVQLTVGGVLQTVLGTISKGQTGSYTVTFTNGSSQDATITCSVTAAPGGGLPVAVPVVTANPITIPKNGTNTCTFTYAFPELVAVNFVATAANVLPLDSNPGNNSVAFTTTAQSDHTFPGIDIANVSAHQQWETSGGLSGTPTSLDNQSMSLNRITLTFAKAAAIIGNFKLTDTVSTANGIFSVSSLTVIGLTPGTGRGAAGVNGPSCVTGVDGGATSVNSQHISLSICAEPSMDAQGNLDPTVQEIFIEMDNSLTGQVLNPPPQMLYGSTLTFNITLGWTLQGSSVPDKASALLQFGLNTTGAGFPNSYVADQTGIVTVVRNGGG